MKELSTPSKERRPRGAASPSARLTLGALAVLLVLCISKIVAHGGAVAFIISALGWVRSLGLWGAPLLFAIEAAAFCLLLPISPLHIGMGFIYGAKLGSVIAIPAYTIGCVPPFLLARVPALADRFVALRRRADMLDGVFSAVELEPFKLIIALRLSPMMPSTLNSYLLGLTNVPLRTYVAASFVGCGPNVAAYVYVGTLLDSLADIAAGRTKKSPTAWALLVVGLVATVGMLAYVSKVATRRVTQARATREGHAATPATPPESGGVRRRPPTPEETDSLLARG